MDILALAKAKQNYLIPLGTGLLGLGVGGVSGWWLVHKKLSKAFDLEVDKAMADAKEYYARLYKTEAFSTVEGAAKGHFLEVENTHLALDEDDAPEEIVDEQTVEGVAEKVEALKYGDPGLAHNDPLLVTTNVFEDSVGYEDTFDLQEELKLRTPDKPYVITKDEYFQNESELEQLSLTYYGGDNVLADDRDKPVDDIEKIVGVANLDRFGEGSEDPNVVYIRNEKLSLEAEINWSQGKYSYEVLGFIEHSAIRQKTPKFKGYDD